MLLSTQTMSMVLVDNLKEASHGTDQDPDRELKVKLPTFLLQPLLVRYSPVYRGLSS